MDVAVELEENWEDLNQTSNLTIDGLPYQSVSAHQMGLLIFSIFCLVPNALIIYIILRNKLSSTVYRIITNWSILNILFILNFVPVSVIPTVMLSRYTLEVIFYFGATDLTFTGILLILFMFDCFVKSELICKYSITIIWCLIFIFHLIAFAIITDEIATLVSIVTLESISFSVILIFLVKVVHSCVNPPREEYHRLRIRLCTTYLICLFLLWSTEFMVYIHRYYVFLVLIATIVIYVDGYINLTVLIYSDMRIKRHFLQIFCQRKKYADLKFDAKNSVVEIVDRTV